MSKQIRAEQAKAKKFWDSLMPHERWELGDQLVLGEVDYLYWFGPRPSSTFMNELDQLRMYWEMEEPALQENPKTPPKSWWTRCVDGVTESGSGAATPQQVCGSLWYHKLSAADKRRITREAEGVQNNPLDTTSALAGVGILTAVILFIGTLKK